MLQTIAPLKPEIMLAQSLIDMQGHGLEARTVVDEDVEEPALGKGVGSMFADLASL